MGKRRVASLKKNMDTIDAYAYVPEEVMDEETWTFMGVTTTDDNDPESNNISMLKPFTPHKGMTKKRSVVLDDKGIEDIATHHSLGEGEPKNAIKLCTSGCRCSNIFTSSVSAFANHNFGWTSILARWG